MTQKPNEENSPSPDSPSSGDKPIEIEWPKNLHFVDSLSEVVRNAGHGVLRDGAPVLPMPAGINVVQFNPFVDEEVARLRAYMEKEGRGHDDPAVQVFAKQLRDHSIDLFAESLKREAQ